VKFKMTWSRSPQDQQRVKSAGHRRGAAAVEEHVQQGRPEVHRDLERRRSARCAGTGSTEIAARRGAADAVNPFTRALQGAIEF
jgi:hypothetical protein